ncbi:MAG: DUF1801 domain-containing protein [Nitrososphaerota archaeon]|nr:DUF1801 domain-containing protein [Nitrososphaerota archaeon]MDG7023069.1 DUF1801 domain-containing protein [Nitrososphaerota archaeon]
MVRASPDVDAYIAAAPGGARGKLRKVRDAIMEAAPAAREGISYRMPYYSYKGRLVWFGLFRGHIGLFIRPPVLEEHRSELKGYAMTESSLHLPLGREAPVPLIEKLVKAAVRKNEGRGSA